jgi:hypothetical protein
MSPDSGSYQVVELRTLQTLASCCSTPSYLNAQWLTARIKKEDGANDGTPKAEWKARWTELLSW